MAKRGYGLAGAIEPGKKIFYGSVFSQLQVGRATDLLCGLAAESGVHVPSLRAALNAALFEACRCQGLFDSSLSSINPVTIEFGADSSRGALSIQFTVADGLEISPALAQALRSAFLPAGEMVFKVDPQTRRAEIYCALPLSLGKEIPLSKPGEARFELLSECSELGDDPSAEYVELGDVEYEKILPQDPGIQAGNEAPSNTPETTRKILRAAMTPDQETVVASAGSNPEALAEVLSSGLPKEELARVVAGGLPEEELAQLVKGSMSPEELAQLVKGGLSEQELATIVKGSSTPEELQQLVKFSGDKAQLAETLLVGSSKEEAAELIKSSIGKEELGNAIATALPREKLAQIAATALPPEEFLQIARDNLPAEDFVQTIKGAMTPQQSAGFAAHAIKNPEICKAVLNTLSPAEMAESLKQAAPQRIVEAAQAAASSMPTQQLIETLSNGLPREEYARMVASSIPREEFARILTDGLPPQEMARSLLEGLPKEKFAQLVASLVPKQELGQALAGLQLETSKLEKAGVESPSPALGPTQEKLEPVQIATLLSPKLTESQALSVLSTVLPQAAAEGIFTGEIPAEHVTEALKPYLPSPELAAQVTDRLVKAREAVDRRGTEPAAIPARKPEAQLSEPAQSGQTPAKPERAGPKETVSSSVSGPSESVKEVSVSKDKDVSRQSVAPAASESKENLPVSFEEERAKLEKVFQARLGTAQKSVEFYLLRSRNLETQLRAAEEAKRTADRDAQAAKLKLENLLEASDENEEESTESPVTAEKGAPAAVRAPRSTVSAKANEVATSAKKAAGSSAVASDRTPSVDEARAKKDREAALFFQKKAREFESELRKAEAEVRRLNAEHAKELLKLSQENASDKGPEKAKDRRPEKEATAPAPERAKSATVASAPAKEQEASKQSAEMSALAAQAHPIVSERIRQLETKVRQAEKEKERLLEQVKRQSDRHLRPGAAKHDAAQAENETESAEVASAETREERSAKPEPASARKAETEARDFAEEPQEITKPRAVAPASDDDPIDVEKKLEANHLEVERDLNTIAQKVERLKDAVPEGAARRMVDGLMTAIMQEKAKLMETSRELTKSVLKKELAFKNQEAMLTESVKQMRGLAEQRQAAIDRLKQQNTEIQQKMDRAAQSQSNNNETQFRMKYEQSQRQIELLNKEIEKANRRLQQAPQNQGNNLAQERMLVEMRKQIENATKAMTAKKQELEMVKVQLHERDRREEQYKRQVMKLQSDLLAARGNKKAS